MFNAAEAETSRASTASAEAVAAPFPPATALKTHVLIDIYYLIIDIKLCNYWISKCRENLLLKKVISVSVMLYSPALIRSSLVADMADDKSGNKKYWAKTTIKSSPQLLSLEKNIKLMVNYVFGTF